MVKKIKILEPVICVWSGRDLHKTKIDKGIHERAVGKLKPNVLSRRKNTKCRELPYG